MYNLKYNLFKSEIERMFDKLEDEIFHNNIYSEADEKMLKEQINSFIDDRNKSKNTILKVINDTENHYSQAAKDFYIRNLPFIININNDFSYNDEPILLYEEEPAHNIKDIRAEYENYLKNYANKNNSESYIYLKTFDNAIKSFDYNAIGFTLRMMWDNHDTLYGSDINEEIQEKIKDIEDKKIKYIEKIIGRELIKPTENNEKSLNEVLKQSNKEDNKIDLIPKPFNQEEFEANIDKLEEEKMAINNKNEFDKLKEWANGLDIGKLEELQSILIQCENDKEYLSDFTSAVDRVYVLKNEAQNENKYKNTEKENKQDNKREELKEYLKNHQGFNQVQENTNKIVPKQ